MSRISVKNIPFILNSFHSSSKYSLFDKLQRQSNNKAIQQSCIQYFSSAQFPIIEENINHQPLILSSTNKQGLKTSLAHHLQVSFLHTMSPCASPKKVLFSPSKMQPAGVNNQAITICVEGNIGSGKTTLLNELALHPDIEVFEEPVEKWRNVRGNNLLDLMYQDPNRWAHLFQTYVQLTMMQLHTMPTNSKVKVIERSIHSARHCFVENHFRAGRMSEPEYNVYCEWYNTITDNLMVPVDLIVYLSAAPDVVQERIIERGRSEEAKIPYSYLGELDVLHKKWLYSEKLPSPLLVLSHDMTLSQMTTCVQEHIAVLLNQRTQSEADSVLTLPIHSPPSSPVKVASASN